MGGFGRHQRRPHQYRPRPGSQDLKPYPPGRPFRPRDSNPARHFSWWLFSDCDQGAIYIDGIFSQPHPAANRVTWSAGVATCTGRLKGGPAGNENTGDRPSFLRRKVAMGKSSLCHGTAKEYLTSTRSTVNSISPPIWWPSLTHQTSSELSIPSTKSFPLVAPATFRSWWMPPNPSPTSL